MYCLKKSLILFWTIYFLFSITPGQDVNADRPGFSTGTYTVDPGFINVESGFSVDYENSGSRFNNFTVPYLNIRFGISKNIELGVLWDGSTISTSPQGRITELSDLSFSGKVALKEELKYNLTLMGIVTVPQKNEILGSYAPTLALLGDYSISSDISASGMIQIAAEEGNGSTNLYIQPALGVTFSHSSEFDTFIEFYMDIPYSNDTKNPYSIYIIDGGFTYAIYSNMVIDLSGGLIQGNGNQFFISGGIAIRL